MQSKKELKEFLKEQEERLEYLRNGYIQEEEYQELWKQHVEIGKKLNTIKTNWYHDNVDSQISCRDEIADIKKMIANKGELNPNDYSEEVQVVFDKYYRGYTCHNKRKLMWVSKDENFILLTMPSHTEYINRMSGSSSSPSEWHLFNIKKALLCTRHDILYDKECIVYKQEGGRWIRNFEKLILEKIEEYGTKR